LKITMEALFEMTLYRSHSHYLARSLSKARLSQLTPAQRKARTRAQQRLSKARLRPTKTFATAVIDAPPPRSPHRDWLALDNPTRDIIRP
jgi:hypothetical protein